MGGAEHSRRAAVRRSRADRAMAARGDGADHAGAAARSWRAMKFADLSQGLSGNKRPIRHCEFHTGLRPTLMDETGLPFPHRPAPRMKRVTFHLLPSPS